MKPAFDLMYNQMQPKPDSRAGWQAVGRRPRDHDDHGAQAEQEGGNTPQPAVTVSRISGQPHPTRRVPGGDGPAADQNGGRSNAHKSDLEQGRHDLGHAHNGMFPCQRGLRLRSLCMAIRNARIKALRVRIGSMTSSTYPRSAAM